MTSLTLIIAVGSGALIGIAVGIYIAALLAHRQIRRAGIEAWKQAETFYRNKQSI